MELKELLKKSKYFLGKVVIDFSFDEVLELQELLINHSDLYYNKEEPIISDKEYDELLKKLESLEKKYDIISKISSNVGSNIKESTFLKVKHNKPMISLDNTYNEEDLEDFDERVKKNIKPPLTDDIINYTIEFKFDGLGVELIYKSGKLLQAITRGNGIEGEDVTENIMQIDNIPKTIDYKGDLELRGEVVMPISSFNELNEKAKIDGGKLFSNPRNAASGSLRLLDNSITKERKLKYFVYDLANFTLPLAPLLIGEGNNYYNVIKSLEKLGFDISSYFVKCEGIKDVINEIQTFGDVKKTIDFEIDGLVIKINDIDLWKQIGSTQHHPRYAIAYKFPAEILTTKILSVEHSIGRTGTITPVANLEPINIGGAIISRATIHNYDEVNKLDIRIGDSIFIKRAGEVIPKIISVIKDVRTGKEEIIHPPEICPSCYSKVLKDKDKVRYYCSNKIDCPASHSEKLAFAVGKQGFNIDGFGEKQVEVFLKEGIIHNLVDIFKIEEKKDEILKLEGFQEKSVNNLISSVEKAKNVDIAIFLTALGITGVGKKTAKVISSLITSPLSPLLIGDGSVDDLEKLTDIGPEIAKNLIEYFGDISHRKILEELVDILNIKYYSSPPAHLLGGEGRLFGKKVCITGSFDNYKREDLIEILEEKGGEFMSSVSKKTDFLLAGEKAGSKLKKANELGIQVLSIEDFLSIT